MCNNTPGEVGLAFTDQLARAPLFGVFSQIMLVFPGRRKTNRSEELRIVTRLPLCRRRRGRLPRSRERRRPAASPPRRRRRTARISAASSGCRPAPRRSERRPENERTVTFLSPLIDEKKTQEGTPRRNPEEPQNGRSTFRKIFPALLSIILQLLQ